MANRDTDPCLLVDEATRDALLVRLLVAAEELLDGFDLIDRVDILDGVIRDYSDWLEATLAEPEPVH